MFYILYVSISETTIWQTIYYYPRIVYEYYIGSDLVETAA